MKIVKYTIYGVLIGLCIGLILSPFVGCQAVGSCSEEWVNAFFSCSKAGCANGCQQFTGSPTVRNCILYSTLICGAIGAVYGSFLTLQERNATRKAAEQEQSAWAKKQREKWAGEVKDTILYVNNVCYENKTKNAPLINTTYKANSQMTDIMSELIIVTEKQGKVNALAEELSKEGDISV